MTRARALLTAALLAAGAAHADANIMLDGNNGDWINTTTCLTDQTGDSANGIDLTRVCLENNNSSGNTGNLFGLFEAASGFGNAQDRYFGFFIDRNNDGAVTAADEVWAIHFSRNAMTPDNLTVYEPVTYNVKRTYGSNTSNCGGPAGANGWGGFQRNSNSGAAPRGVVELRISYGCLGLTAGTDERLMQLGVYPNFDVTNSVYYDGTNNTIVLAGPPPDVINFTIAAGANQNRLTWTNPTPHLGTLVLRSTGSAPNTPPAAQVTYTVGQNIGNATVRYVDDNGSTTNAFTDTGLVNGTRYFYKIYNHHQRKTYSSGAAPSSQGLFADPTSKTGGAPYWCYSVGFPSLQQPTTELGQRVFTASNGRMVTANLTQPGANDGWEAWRPAQLDGGVQSRATLVPLAGRAGNWLVVGDQSGRGYLIDSDTGAIDWVTAKLGDAIQGQPVAQLYAFSDAGFRSAHPNRDLLFFGTRNNSTTNNAVYGISSVNGQAVWTYQPGNLNIISGGMAVDYDREQVWVASRGNPSLRVLSTVNGALAGSVSGLGDLDHGVNLRFTGGAWREAVTINTAGTVYGVDLATRQVRWSRALGAAPSAWVFPLSTGFIASVQGATNQLRRYDVLPDAGTALVWQTTLAGANGISVDFASQTFYAAGTSGVLRQMSLSDGGTVREVRLADGGTPLGHPTYDPTSGRVHVGTFDGRVCAFPAPLP